MDERPTPQRTRRVSDYETWAKSRSLFRQEKSRGDNPLAWQRHYTQGASPGGVHAPEHQVKLKLRAFTERERPLQDTPDSDPSQWSIRNITDVNPAKEVGNWDIVKDILTAIKRRKALRHKGVATQRRA